MEHLEILMLKVVFVSKLALKVLSLTKIIIDNVDLIVYLHYIHKIPRIHVKLTVSLDFPMNELNNVLKYAQQVTMDSKKSVINISVLAPLQQFLQTMSIICARKNVPMELMAIHQLESVLRFVRFLNQCTLMTQQISAQRIAQQTLLLIFQHVNV